MRKAITKLTQVGGAALSELAVTIPEDFVSASALHQSGLYDLLHLKNGFYAFESALHVFPSAATGGERGIAEWNSPSGWREEYQDLAGGCLFFAEDVFGGQFCLFDGAIMSFDPETGEKQFLSANVEGWAEQMLADFEVMSGFSLAHAWQSQHGALPPGQRLVPKTPFVLGGEVSLANLFSLDAEQAMRSRGHVAMQIRGLPDGTTVNLEVVDH
jgi:hypothetical protein